MVKANLVLGQLSRAVTYRDKTTFIRLYQVYVRPHLEYAALAGVLGQLLIRKFWRRSNEEQ